MKKLLPTLHSNKKQIIVAFLVIVIAFVSKQNANAQVFQHAFSYGGVDYQAAHKIVIDNEGNKIIVGTFRGTYVDFNPSKNPFFLLSSVGDKDIYIAKFSSTGNFIKAIGIGGIGNDVGISVATDNVGNIYITGWFRGTVDFDPSSNVANVVSNGESGTDLGYNGEVYLAKYNTNLEYQWAFNIGGTGVNDAGTKVRVDNNGNVYLGGYFAGSNVDFDPSPTNQFLMSTAGLHATEGFVAKYTSSGSFVWVVKFGESAAYDAGVRDFIFDSNNNLYAVGYFSGTIDLAPGSSTSNFTSNGCGDIFLVKLDNSKNYVWGFKIGGSNCDYSMSIGVDATNNVYITGTISSLNIDFDPGLGVANLSSTSAGNNDAFIAKYTDNGSFVYAFTLGSTGADAAYQVLVQDAAFTVVGYFSETIDADPGLGVQNLTSSGLQDIYVIRYALDGTLLNAYQFGSSSTDDCAFGITGNGNHAITFVGTFGGTNVDFDPSTGQALLSSSDGYDAFFASFDFNASLPSTLTSFSALQKGKDIVLNWTVTNEINVSYYDIEYSKDNTRFSSIGTMQAKNGSAEIAYTKTHYGISNGTHFYRIKTVDKDGKFVYSNVIRIEITTPNELLVYPNPATTDKIKIRYNAVSNAKYQAVIINANGQIVRQENLSELMNGQDIYIGNLAKGIYTIRLIDDNKGNISTATFIKAN